MQKTTVAYIGLAIVVLGIAFFAIMPFISDLSSTAGGPTLTAMLVRADGEGGGAGDPGGEGGGAGDPGGEGGGAGDPGGEGGGAGDPGTGCCGDGDPGTPGDPGTGGDNPDGPSDPIPAPTCSVQISVRTLPATGGPVTLSWSTTNATRVTGTIRQLNGTVETLTDLPATHSVTGAVSVTTTYTLSVEGAGGTTSCSETVTVSAPIPAPTCSIQTSVRTLPATGGNVTLSWTTTNATRVTGTIRQSNGNVETLTDLPATHSVTGPVGMTTTYTITVEGAGGTTSCSETVTVTTVSDPLPTCTLTISATQLPATGGNVTLSWSTTNSTRVTGIIRQSNGNVETLTDLPATHSVTGPVGMTTTYTITVVGTSGTVSCQKVVTVATIPNDPAPTCTLDSNPTSITRGNAATLSWTTSADATSATIDQGINAVSLTNRTQSVSPSNTTTYTMTVRDAAGQIGLCTRTVTVTTVSDPAPTCTLIPSPATITRGQSTMLNWTTANASTASIDQGVAASAQLGSGSLSVSPVNTTTYTMTVVGAGNVTNTCVGTVVVNPVVQPLVTCDAFTANPQTLNAAGNTTLTWNTTNATILSINNGIGNVVADGSREVRVEANTVFILTASDGGTPVTCQVPVTIVPGVIVPTCDAFTVNPSSGASGRSATLAWSTTNATNVSINNGVGALSVVDGSQNVTINGNTTYILTAGNGVATTSCQVSASVTDDQGGGGGGGGSSSPKCTLTASDKSIKSGDKVTLSWKNTRTNDIILKDSRGKVIADSKKDNDVNEDKDSVVVSPTKSTSYVLTVIRGSKKRDCAVDIQVDNVTVKTTRSQEPLVAGISLARVPYTGFEAGPALTAFFYGLLVLWGFAVAYMLVMRDATGGVKTAAHNMLPKIDGGTQAHEAVGSFAATAPFNLPIASLPVLSVQTAPTVSVPESALDTAILEAHAHESRVLLSSDALSFIMDHGMNTEERIEVLNMITGAALGAFPKENGWLALNKAKILTLVEA